MMIGVLMVAFMVIAMLVALGAKHGSRPCELSFRVATYGGNSYISEIEINNEGRLVAMTHNDVIGKHSPYPLQSEGAVEYYVSVRFGVWAEKELGEKYYSSNKGWKTFCCPVPFGSIHPAERSSGTGKFNSSSPSSKPRRYLKYA